MCSWIKALLDPKVCIKIHAFVFVFIGSSSMGTQVHVFEFIAWNLSFCNSKFWYLHSSSSCPCSSCSSCSSREGNPNFSDLISLNVAIEATPRQGGVGPRPRPGNHPACFPEMRNSVLFCLSLVLKDVEIICMHVNLFESAFNRPCHVFVGLGLSLDPDVEERGEWYFR